MPVESRTLDVLPEWLVERRPSTKSSTWPAVCKEALASPPPRAPRSSWRHGSERHPVKVVLLGLLALMFLPGILGSLLALVVSGITPVPKEAAEFSFSATVFVLVLVLTLRQTRLAVQNRQRRRRVASSSVSGQVFKGSPLTVAEMNERILSLLSRRIDRVLRLANESTNPLVSEHVSLLRGQLGRGVLHEVGLDLEALGTLAALPSQSHRSTKEQQRLQERIAGVFESLDAIHEEIAVIGAQSRFGVDLSATEHLSEMLSWLRSYAEAQRECAAAKHVDSSATPGRVSTR